MDKSGLVMMETPNQGLEIWGSSDQDGIWYVTQTSKIEKYCGGQEDETILNMLWWHEVDEVLFLLQLNPFLQYLAATSNIVIVICPFFSRKLLS